MLIVFLYTFLYDVKSLFATGSPTESSTPGGIERGVRPSLEGRFEVVEKGAAVARGAAVACHAGTKKPGSVTGPDDDAVMARPNAFPLLGANMAAIGVDMAVVGVLQCWLAGSTDDVQTIEAQLFVLSHDITCCGNSSTTDRDKSGPIADIQIHLICSFIYKIDSRQ